MELTREAVLDLVEAAETLAARLRVLAGGAGGEAHSGVDGDAADLTVGDVSAHLQRSASTVRGWLEAGRFPGAYKLPGDAKHAAWRIPGAALAAFKASSAAVPDIGAYRRHLRRSAPR